MRLTILISILIILSICSFAQKNNVDVPNDFVGSFGWQTNDFPETLSNMRDKLVRFNLNGDTLAVVVCSDDSLPVALVTAAGSPITEAKKLESEGIIEFDPQTGKPTRWQYYIPKKDIIFLRQVKNCPLVENKYLYTAYWIVHKGNELPPFVEARKSSDFSEYILTYFYDRFYELPDSKEGIKLTPEIYKIALNKLVDSLKQNRTAIAVIQIPYSGKLPNKKILSNVLLAQTFLKKNGIGSHRIFVRKLHFDDYTSFNDSSTSKYPNITIVFQDGR